MFAKQAYEKRLKKQDEDLTKLLNKKKVKPPQIGSVKNDKVNYDKQQQFFTKEDIPFNVKTIKEEINQLIDPDHLGLRKKQWNTSVGIPKSFDKEETHEQKLLKIKLGFTDHPIPKYSEPKIYQGTQLRDDYTHWSVSNQPNSRQVKENLLKKTHSALENTKFRQTQYLKNYANPLSRTTTFIEAGKRKVEDESSIRQNLKQKYIFENPTASDQKIRGAVFRLAYETAVKQKKDDIEALAMDTDFKASLTITQKNKVTAQFTHNGIYQKFISKLPGEEDYFAWSCCHNEDSKSRGCTYSIKDKNKWNLSSYNNS